MKHSEVLGRYVNTGKHIPEKQYNRISPSLQRSYKRKKFNNGNLYEWEFKLLSFDEQIIYIEKKGKKLSKYDISNLLEHSDNKDDIAIKIIDTKGEKLDGGEIFILLQDSINKELIIKKLLQNGVSFKLINKTISNNKINIPLIPYNYQSMLNEIRRIKEIMI
jgi:hypothetical protein